MYNCSLIIIIYPVHLFDSLLMIISNEDNWLDLESYLDLHVVFSSFELLFSEYILDSFIRSGIFVCLWNDYYLISSSLIVSLFPQICMLYIFIWIVVASMFVPVLPEVIPLYDYELLTFVYHVHCFILYLLRSLCFYKFNYCSW